MAGPKLNLSFMASLNCTGAKTIKSQTHFPLEMAREEFRSWSNTDPLLLTEQEHRHIQAQMEEKPFLPQVQSWRHPVLKRLFFPLNVQSSAVFLADLYSGWRGKGDIAAQSCSQLHRGSSPVLWALNLNRPTCLQKEGGGREKPNQPGLLDISAAGH